MSPVRGMTWAMETRERTGFYLYAVVGDMLLNRSPSYLWYGASYDDRAKIDSMVLAAMKTMEIAGGMLIVGPVEFEVPASAFEDDGLMDQKIGEVAERALGLRGIG